MLRTRPNLLLTFFVGTVFVSCAVVSCFGIVAHFPNVDEVAHLPSGLAHWKYERFDMYRVNPPLVRMVAAFPNWLAGVDTYDWDLYSNRVGERSEFSIGPQRLREVKLQLHREYVWPRLFCLSFSLVGMACLTWWVFRVYGQFSAAMVCVFWCFSPNLLAHAQTIVPDVGSVALGVVACFAFWRYVHNPNAEAAVLAGGCLGLALLTKLTWITAIVTLPATALICAWVFRRSLPSRTWKRRTSDMLIVWTVTLVVLNAGYLFEGTCTQLKDYEFCSQALGGPGCNSAIHGNRFQDSLLGILPVPVPKNYLLGIDYLKFEVEAKRWSFLCGEWRFGSWPHYYVLTTLFKTPEATLLAAGLGMILCIARIWRREMQVEAMTMLAVLSVPALVAFASVSLQGGFNHHHRYVLQIYPLLFVLAAGLANAPRATAETNNQFANNQQDRFLSLRQFISRTISQHRLRIVAAGLTLCMLVSSLSVHPHYLSYFNTISGGPRNGWHLLGFSNIDWGQDLLFVDDWIQQHPDCRPLSFELDYYGMNGELFDLPPSQSIQLPTGTSLPQSEAAPAQYYIVNVRKLYNLPGRSGLEYLQQLEPYDTIAYSFHVYRVQPNSDEAY